MRRTRYGGTLGGFLVVWTLVAGAGQVAPSPAVAAPSAVVAPAWTTAWATAPSAAVNGVTTGFAGYTIRNVVHLTVGGARVRVHLSNRFGTEAVLFGHVTVAVSAHAGGRTLSDVDPSDGSVRAGTVRHVQFGGSRQVTVAAGSEVVSDPVDLSVGADQDLLVSTWTPNASGTVTYHPSAMQDSFLSRGPADHAADPSATAFTERTQVWHYLSGVDVGGAAGTVVALGDSITDGVASTRGANRRWTDYLAARLVQSSMPAYGVANSGISANRVLLDANFPNYTIFSAAGPSALHRLQPDALDRAGARTVVLFEGINDIQQTPQQTDPQQIIAGLTEIADRAHARGLRVIGATIMAWRGWRTYTPQLDVTRDAVNAWIRDGGAGKLDAVVDFDAATRDPADPRQLLPAYDSGDHLHPNDLGDRAMAEVVPLAQL